MDKKLEQHNSQSYHFEFVGFADFKKVLKDLIKFLPYYRFDKIIKRHSQEIFYDIKSHLLADAGIAISKCTEDGESSLNIRKIYSVKELKKPSEKFLFGICDYDEQPKDYSYQMASLIESSFKMPFSTDTESIIKQTVPIIEINIKADKYQIICGTGYRAIMQYETVVYKDLNSGRKEERIGMTFKFPIDERPEKEEILSTIDKKIKGLALNNISRFEIAKKLLFSTPVEVIPEEQSNEEQ